MFGRNGREAPGPGASRATGPTNANNIRVKRNNVIISIVSQNVRGLKSDERLEELFTSINTRNIFAACLQETWRSGNETIEYGPCRLVHGGLDPEDQCRRGSQGVAIVLSARGADAWRAFGYVIHQDLGARIIGIRLLVQDMQKRDVGLFLISAYAPIGIADEET